MEDISVMYCERTIVRVFRNALFVCYSRPLGERVMLATSRSEESLQVWYCDSVIRQVEGTQFLQLMCVVDYSISK